MSVTLQNVRGLNTKTNTFYLNALNSESDVIILSETWLREDIRPAEYFDECYEVYQRNGGNRGRGVLVAVKNGFSSSDMKLRTPDDAVDLVGVKLGNQGNYINIIAVYIPPAKPSYVYEAIFEYIELTTDLTKRTIFAGDFNIPEYNYEQNILGSKGTVNALHTFMAFNAMNQINNIPNKNGRYLDLVLCSEDIVFEITRQLDPLVKEDDHHPSLELLVRLSNFERNIPFVTQHSKYYYNYKKCDLTTLYTELAFKSWEDLYKISNVDEATDFFYNDLMKCVDSFVPCKPIKNRTYPKWYTPQLIKLIEMKNRYRKLCKKLNYNIIPIWLIKFVKKSSLISKKITINL